MSYARFGPDSDVYLFPHSGGYVECCGCHLATESVALHSGEAVVDHLITHTILGHEVPERLLDPDMYRDDFTPPERSKT